MSGAPSSRSSPPPLSPVGWARTHDLRQPRDFLFWRGADLAAQACLPRVRPGDLWVDVGCGPGHLTAALAAAGARVLGVDLDPAMAAYARARWRLPFVAAGAGSLPLPAASCSGIVAVSLLGYLAQPADLFHAAAHALAPGGILCFTAMNCHSLLLAAAKLVSLGGLAAPGNRPDLAELSDRATPGRPAGRRRRYLAHDPLALVAALRTAGLTPERQLFYGRALVLGDRLLPRPEAAGRRETAVPPGSRALWPRQVLVVARRAAAGAASAAGSGAHQLGQRVEVTVAGAEHETVLHGQRRGP